MRVYGIAVTVRWLWWKCRTARYSARSVNPKWIRLGGSNHMTTSKKAKNRKIEPGSNIHLDRLLAIYPDDQEIFRIDDKIVLKPKGTTLEEAENE